MLLTGCTREDVVVRPIAATLLLDCPLESSTALELEALDDLAPRASSFVEVSLTAGADVATLPSSARTFLARGRDPGGELTALGILSVRDERARGPIYRAGAACAFRDGAGARARFPALSSPSIASSARFAVLAGGEGADLDARSDVVIVDGERAVAERLGMRRRRLGAAVAVAEGRAIVAGGNAGAEIWEDAEVVDLNVPAIAPAAIPLAEKRTEAGAAVLASGEVLLAGGRGPSGPLRTMEIVDIARGRARTIDVAALSRPRRSPAVVRLSTGEVLVLGGLDEAGAPVPDVEVFDVTVQRRLAILPFSALPRVRAVALPSGAALVVHADAAITHAALVRADAVEALADPPHGSLPHHLVEGTDGAPFVFNGRASRFDPFLQRWGARELPLAGAHFALDFGVLAEARVEDGGLAIRATRYDLRPPLVVDTESLGLGSAEHLSPDRVGPAITRDGLLLTPRSRVAITDATFRGVTLRLNASGRDLPGVELRSDDTALVARIGDDTPCPWPTSAGSFAEIVREPSGAISIRVGDVVKLCAPLVARDRVHVVLVAGTAEARVRGLTLTRR